MYPDAFDNSLCARNPCPGCPLCGPLDGFEPVEIPETGELASRVASLCAAMMRVRDLAGELKESKSTPDPLRWAANYVDECNLQDINLLLRTLNRHESK